MSPCLMTHLHTRFAHGNLDHGMGANLGRSSQKVECCSRLDLPVIGARLQAQALQVGARRLKVEQMEGKEASSEPCTHSSCLGNLLQDVHVTGMDVNESMAPYAQEAAAAAGLPSDRLRLVTGDCQALPLEDDSFDLVVSTLVSYRCFHLVPHMSAGLPPTGCV